MYIFDNADNALINDRFFSQTRCVDAKAEVLDKDGTVIADLNSERHIISMEISRGVQTENDFIGCAVSKEYNFKFKENDLPNLAGKHIKPYIGIESEGIVHYVPFPAGIIYETEFDTVKKVWRVTCYDKMQKLNSILLKDVWPDSTDITLREYAAEICASAGITLCNRSFFNEDMIVGTPNFSGEESLREVVAKIAQAALSNAVINRNDEMEFISVVKTPSECGNIEFTGDEYFDFREDACFGPINTVVLSRAETEDNVYYPAAEERTAVYMDENSTLSVADHIQQFGVNELKIFDNPFFDQSVQNVEDDTRTEYVQHIFEHMRGQQYHAYILEHRGNPAIDEGDRIFIRELDGNVIETTYFSDVISFDGGLRAVSEGKIISQTATDYDSAGSIKETLKKTQIKVDKHEGKINAFTEDISLIELDLKNNYVTVTDANELVQTAADGLTNVFSKTGGANLLRNTAPYFGSDSSWEYWNGEVGRINENDSQSGYALLLKGNNVSQSVAVPPGVYSLGFKYKVLNSAASIGRLKWNGQVIDLLEERDENIIYLQFEAVLGNIIIEMECDIDDAIEIYDLMLNSGEVCMEWTQNANETVSDTVNISKGIEVISNTTNTKTRLDSDGFRVLDNSGQTILRATCQGGTANVETAYLTSRKGAKISGLSIQQVESEVWISGIQ